MYALWACNRISLRTMMVSITGSWNPFCKVPRPLNLDCNNNLWRIEMQKSLNIDPGKCTGCLQCEMACSYEHTGTFNPSRSYIKVFTFHHEGRFAPYTCTQCEEAWCQRACPVDAISVDMATGAKVISDDKCVGCKVCTIACPFGTVNY